MSVFYAFRENWFFTLKGIASFRIRALDVVSQVRENSEAQVSLGRSSKFVIRENCRRLSRSGRFKQDKSPVESSKNVSSHCLAPLIIRIDTRNSPTTLRRENGGEKVDTSTLWHFLINFLYKLIFLCSPTPILALDSCRSAHIWTFLTES